MKKFLVPYYTMELAIMVGLPASGKTTWAAQHLVPKGFAHLQSDIIRSPKRMEKEIRSHLQAGHSVVVDATHVTRERRARVLGLARQYGVKTPPTCYVMNVSKDAAWQRNKVRRDKKPVPAPAFFSLASSFEDVTPDECRVVDINPPAAATRSTPARAPTTSRRVPESPAKAHPGVTRVGRDGRMYISSKRCNGVWYWKPKSASSSINQSIITNSEPKPNKASFALPPHEVIPHPPTQRPQSRRPFSIASWSPMLAHPYDEAKHNLAAAAWYASEKLDGVRAVWDGSNLYTRGRNLIKAPRWFKAAIPAGFLFDGELFAGRGNFNFVNKVWRSGSDAEWRKLQYRVFDRPVADGRPFEVVLRELRSQLPECTLDVTRFTACLVPQHRVSPSEVAAMHAQLLSNGAEGVMLRRADVGYVGKRSDYVLKLKGSDDAEAAVVGYERGRGAREGGLGALVCEWEHQGKRVRFKVGTGFSARELQDYRRLFRIGSTITVKFQHINPATGRPRHPVFKGIRRDLGQ
jgi:DNA ligase 1